MPLITEPTLVPLALREAARTFGPAPALRVRGDGSWPAVSWAEYGATVERAARGLLRLGVQPGDGVVIKGPNRPEWFVADLAAIFAGARPAGIYTTSTAEQASYVARHADAAVAVLADPADVALFRGADLPRLRAVVLMEGAPALEGTVSWRELLALGDQEPAENLEARLAAQRPDDCATLIYTSGTTGTPKAVMLSHANLLWVSRQVPLFAGSAPGDRVLSYLPLSHIAEQINSLYAPLHCGSACSFVESLDKLGEALREVRPTLFFGVPRVWEKMQAAIAAAGAQAPPLVRRLSAWARRIGAAAGEADQKGARRPLLYPLANALVFSRVRRKLGLDAARFCAVSAAPIGVQTLEFFQSLGIPVFELYGMSECTAPTTLSVPGRYRLGTVGVVLPGTELRLAEDGEVLVRGPHVFLGYAKDEKATREVLEPDGWLHTGDVGTLDADGFLRITDRKKELIITSGGKNVAPQPIESKLRAIPGVAHAVVIGERRPYVGALLTLDPLRLPEIARAAGSPARTLEEAAACSVLRRALEAAVDAVNLGLARYESVRRFEVLPLEFSVEGGELTPTLKLRRRVVEQKHAAPIERLYAATAAGATG